MRQASIGLLSSLALIGACGGLSATDSEFVVDGGGPFGEGGGGESGGGAGGAVGGTTGLGGTAPQPSGGTPGSGGGPPAWTCSNGSADGPETDVDCGGGVCPGCAAGKSCSTEKDCTSGICLSGTCYDATIASLQSGYQSLSCPPDSGNVTWKQGLKLGPMVVASFPYPQADSLSGYYVQTPLEWWGDGMFGGMLLLLPATLPTSFAPGDLLQVTGDYAEFHCLTEVVATTAIKIGSAAVAPPIVLPASLFAGGGGVQSEPYEGSIVAIENVVVTDSSGGSQPKWWFKVTGGVFVTNDFGIAGSAPPVGTPIKRLTGGVKSAFGLHLIAPRSKSEIELS